MNKQLELFLNRLDFDGVYKGELTYSGLISPLFMEAPRYMPRVPRSEDSELRLSIEVTKTCSIRCEIYTFNWDEIATTEFSMINATPGAIEDWILSIDFDAIGNEVEEPELAEVKV